MEGIAHRVEEVQPAFGAVAEAVPVGVAPERVAGHAGCQWHGHQVALDFFAVGQAVAVGVSPPGIGAIAQLQSVVQAVAIGIWQVRVRAIPIFLGIGHAVAVAVRFGAIGVKHWTKAGAVGQTIAIQVNLVAELAPGDELIQGGGQDVQHELWAQVAANRGFGHLVDAALEPAVVTRAAPCWWSARAGRSG